MAEQIILVRHATADLSEQPRYVGTTDLELTGRGRREAERLALLMARREPDACLASPLKRAVQTAERAIQPLALPVRTKTGLREIDFGRWEGKTFGQIEAEDPDLVQRWVEDGDAFRFPGGESIGGFYERVSAVAEALRQAPEARPVVFTHGGVVRGLICALTGVPFAHRLAFRVEPASVTTIEMVQETGVLCELNTTAHLEGIE
jgi:broad specificity phosphatase PhoE